ncbi:MAG: Protein of unknown function DUF819 [uncultured Sulfurovum sp.]|uniref:DUF819 domain-containing protein n=1 Tax=uncultured Sulfurovum sp. TaxID=269237 RepID=A0A6S6U2Z5_9BACT|nr:MAG: Protein of unknown function DUF819 [uncultured Sulfurovum sp.]
MITTAFPYLTILIFIASLLVYLEKETKAKLFDYLPAIVILYFTVMTLSSLELWTKTEEINLAYKSFKSNLLPAMIFLMLLQSDIRSIFKLGKKILLTFFLASLSISLGFIVMFFLLNGFFEEGAWKAFGALSGSWMGGTGNMVAIQAALELPDSKMGYVLLIDSIDYAIWVMILLALVPFANKFNKWTKADGELLNKLSQTLDNATRHKAINFASLFMLLGLALMVSVIAQALAPLLPSTSFLTNTTWIVIIATLAGILFGMTPLSKEASAQPLANIMLYLIVALIASRANFAELSQAPLYIFAGFVIIAIHAMLMVLFAKLFKLDLFSLGVASLANIGGVASAPILAGAYHKALIPIGVLMAMMGYILGTFMGLGVSQVLKFISI